jgi:hypothetical protein
VADPVPDGAIEADPFWFATVSDATGIECDGASLDIRDPSYAPLPDAMGDPYSYAFHAQVGVDPGDQVSDYFWDGDGDGDLDEYSAWLAVTLYDASYGELCTLYYDASGAAPVDPAQWTALDVDLAASGPIWSGWELTLADPTSSDCGRIDAAVYGTTDPAALFEGLVVGFGFGEINELTAHGQDFFGSGWGTLQSDAFASYITLDGVHAFEVDFAFLYDVDDCLVLDEAEGLHPPDLAEGGVSGVYLASAYYVWSLVN